MRRGWQTCGGGGGSSSSSSSPVVVKLSNAIFEEHPSIGPDFSTYTLD